MVPNDVSMSEEDKNVLTEFITINETVKRLDKNKKILNEKVKDIFKKYNIEDSLVHDGNTLTVTDSIRKTILKGKKDEFINKLIEKGKSYLVQTVIDVDTDCLYEEYKNGLIEKDFVESYMSVTPVKTLTCK